MNPSFSVVLVRLEWLSRPPSVARAASGRHAYLPRISPFRRCLPPPFSTLLDLGFTTPPSPFSASIISQTRHHIVASLHKKALSTSSVFLNPNFEQQPTCFLHRNFRRRTDLSRIRVPSIGPVRANDNAKSHKSLSILTSMYLQAMQGSARPSRFQPIRCRILIC